MWWWTYWPFRLGFMNQVPPDPEELVGIRAARPPDWIWSTNPQELLLRPNRVNDLESQQLEKARHQLAYGGQHTAIGERILFNEQSDSNSCLHEASTKPPRSLHEASTKMKFGTTQSGGYEIRSPEEIILVNNREMQRTGQWNEVKAAPYRYQ